MKIIQNILLLITLIVSVNAKSFTVGGKILEIPSPKGFVLVTPQMDAVHRVSLQLVDPMNDQLAYYITESDVPDAMAGEIPSLERTCILKVHKKLKNMVIGVKEFAQMKDVIKQQNQKIFKTMEAKIPSMMDNISKGISKEFDTDFAVKVSNMVPLDTHYETDNVMAYSVYYNYGASAEGHKEDLIVSSTSTLVNISGKVLFLYCYGAKEDLEWTRSASKAWAERIIKNNTQPPSNSPGNGGIDWERVIEKGIAGAIIGGLIVLLSSFFSRSKKKK